MPRSGQAQHYLRIGWQSLEKATKPSLLFCQHCEADDPPSDEKCDAFSLLSHVPLLCACPFDVSRGCRGFPCLCKLCSLEIRMASGAASRRCRLRMALHPALSELTFSLLNEGCVLRGAEASGDTIPSWPVVSLLGAGLGREARTI